jgi:hypothetical protein
MGDCHTLVLKGIIYHIHRDNRTEPRASRTILRRTLARWQLFCTPYHLADGMDLMCHVNFKFSLTGNSEVIHWTNW